MRGWHTLPRSASGAWESGRTRITGEGGGGGGVQKEKSKNIDRLKLNPKGATREFMFVCLFDDNASSSGVYCSMTNLKIGLQVRKLITNFKLPVNFKFEVLHWQAAPGSDSDPSPGPGSSTTSITPQACSHNLNLNASAAPGSAFRVDSAQNSAVVL